MVYSGKTRLEILHNKYNAHTHAANHFNTAQDAGRKC